MSTSWIGRVLTGRYELQRHVARGGMAEVYQAHDQLLDRPVALKVLFPEFASDRSFVERFRREAQAAANLSHPNIVPVYDWGQEEGVYFIVMEYVQGNTLSMCIRDEAPLEAGRAADIAAEVAAALAFAHRNGVVHRDVKPGNVLMSPTGTVKVADFGIARAGDSAENLTQTGAVMGTATYFSPEQAQGQSVDARSDVYSLGVVLYEMVTGSPPFTGDNPVSIAYKHVREEPAPPRERNPTIPADFEAIVMKAMAKDTDARYQSADELRTDLLRFRQGDRPTAAVAAVPGPAADPTRAITTVGATGATIGVTAEASRGRRAGVFIGLTLALLAILGLLLFLLARSLGVGGDTGAATVEVPLLVGQTDKAALETLDSLGLEGLVESENNDEAPPNTVFRQDPAPGTPVDEGSSVTLFVSSGGVPVVVPDVVGETLASAREVLEDAGFEITVTEQPDDEREAGTVIEQSPGAGEEVGRGSAVQLVVSTGVAEVEVPNDLVGLTAAEAGRRLDEVDLTAETVDEPSEEPRGRVIRTDPPGGTQLTKGSVVTLFVSSGPTTTTTLATLVVPDVRGQTETAARSELSSAGFRVSVRYVPVTSADDDGVVLDQTPEGGTQAPKGETVTIRVGRQVLSTSSSTTTSSPPPSSSSTTSSGGTTTTTTTRP